MVTIMRVAFYGGSDGIFVYGGTFQSLYVCAFKHILQIAVSAVIISTLVGWPFSGVIG